MLIPAENHTKNTFQHEPPSRTLIPFDMPFVTNNKQEQQWYQAEKSFYIQ